MRIVLVAATIVAACVSVPVQAVGVIILPSGSPVITSGQTETCKEFSPQNCTTMAPVLRGLLGSFSFEVPQLDGTFDFGPVFQGPNSNAGVYSANGSITFDGGSLISNVINFRYSSTQLGGGFVTTTSTIGFYKDSSVLITSTGQVLQPVPEPATWAMLLVGFGAVGFAMRRKSKVTTRVQFA